MYEINSTYLNKASKRFLPLPRSAVEGLEHEPTKSDFDYIKEIGHGSSGIVYLVSHKVTKAQYALKVINKLLPENIKEKQNFNREVEIMYKLNHENIIKLYSHFEDSNYCYLLMNYAPKRLYESMKKTMKVKNMRTIASIVKDVIKAIYYMHNMNPPIVHRDIKPENILLDDNNKAYLTDFGWSNYIRNFRRRHTVCGTPYYLPPEMLEERGHNEKADIWCIGVLIFELVTGEVPFKGKGLQQVGERILNLDIEWPTHIDSDAKDLISKILRHNEDERLSIEEILNHKFFTKFFPHAAKELIKPEIRNNNKIFVVSRDTPKTLNDNFNIKKRVQYNTINHIGVKEIINNRRVLRHRYKLDVPRPRANYNYSFLNYISKKPIEESKQSESLENNSKEEINQMYIKKYNLKKYLTNNNSLCEIRYHKEIPKCRSNKHTIIYRPRNEINSHSKLPEKSYSRGNYQRYKISSKPRNCFKC